MKKIISILFILCISFCQVEAQGFLSKAVKAGSAATKSVSRPIIIPNPIWLATPHGVPGPVVPKILFVTSPQAPDPIVLTRPRVFTTPQNINILSTPAQNNVRTPIPVGINHFEIENRGFIPERHLSTSQEQQKFTTESNEEGASSPHIVNPPKVNLDKIRMKVMMKQNRLNKAEMITDEFIFISLLIYHNEYGEYCITDYAA